MLRTRDAPGVASGGCDTVRGDGLSVHCVMAVGRSRPQVPAKLGHTTCVYWQHTYTCNIDVSETSSV